jgi:hypothetical protein
VYLGEHFVLKVCVIDTGESVGEGHGEAIGNTDRQRRKKGGSAIRIGGGGNEDNGVERRRWRNADRQEAMAMANVRQEAIEWRVNNGKRSARGDRKACE